MGVSAEMLGKAVRCPHCKQAVHAPATTAAPVPVPPPEPPAPVFNVSKREAADSILSDPEESDDEVFATPAAHKLRIPDLPPAPPPAADGDPFAFGVPPPPRPAAAPPPPAPPELAAATSADPFGDFGLDEAAAPAALVRAVRTVEATLEAADEPAPRRGRQTVADDPAKPWKMAVYGLAVYAALMTILALYGLTRTPSADHPTQPTPTKRGR